MYLVPIKIKACNCKWILQNQWDGAIMYLRSHSSFFDLLEIDPSKLFWDFYIYFLNFYLFYKKATTTYKSNKSMDQLERITMQKILCFYFVAV